MSKFVYVSTSINIAELLKGDDIIQQDNYLNYYPSLSDAMNHLEPLQAAPTNDPYEEWREYHDEYSEDDIENFQWEQQVKITNAYCVMSFDANNLNLNPNNDEQNIESSTFNPQHLLSALVIIPYTTEFGQKILTFEGTQLDEIRANIREYQKTQAKQRGLLNAYESGQIHSEVLQSEDKKFYIEPNSSYEEFYNTINHYASQYFAFLPSDIQKLAAGIFDEKLYEELAHHSHINENVNTYENHTNNDISSMYCASYDVERCTAISIARTFESLLPIISQQYPELLNNAVENGFAAKATALRLGTQEKFVTLNGFAQHIPFTNPIQKPECSPAEMLVYQFANTISANGLWNNAETPNCTAAAHPVTLQKAYEDMIKVQRFEGWQESNHELADAQYYQELLHELVDFACEHYGWSMSDNQELHAAADRFMDEMKDPYFGHASELWNIAVQAIGQYSVEDLQNNLQVPEHLAESGLQMMQLVANDLLNNSPEFITSQLALSMCKISCELMSNMSEAIQKQRHCIEERCPVEAAFLTTMMNSSKTCEQIPSCVYQALKVSPLQIDILYAFRDTQVDLGGVVGEKNVKSILDQDKRLREIYNADFMCKFYSSDRVNKYEMEQSRLGKIIIKKHCKVWDESMLQRAFMHPTPATESIFNQIKGVVNTMSLPERKYFLVLFQQKYAKYPASATKALESAYAEWCEKYKTNTALSNAVKTATQDTAAQDKQLLQEMRNTVTPHSITQYALEWLEQIAQHAGVPAETWQKFSDAVSSRSLDHIKSSYAQLETLPQRITTILSQNPQWKEFCKHLEEPLTNINAIWEQLIDTSIHAHMQYGGYQFEYENAYEIAEQLNDLMDALPIQERTALALHFDEAVMVEEENIMAHLDTVLPQYSYNYTQAYIHQINEHDLDNKQVDIE